MQNKEDFEKGLARCIGDTFAGHPEIRDHRREHPWLTGSLGNPFSGIWFLAESPSLSKIETRTKMGVTSAGRKLTPEAQWGSSQGSQVLREALVRAGFKDSPWNSPGGWHCYITNVIKNARYAEKWGKGEKLKAAEIWAPVLRWQLEQSSPQLVVLMGGTVEKLVQHLEHQGMISPPSMRKIHHYSYIAFRAEGKLGPMHPERVKKYQGAMLSIRNEFKKFDV